MLFGDSPTAFLQASVIAPSSICSAFHDIIFFSLTSSLIIHHQHLCMPCLQELRRGKYTRTDSTEPGVLQTIASLGLEVESGPPGGAVVLLPPATLELLLVDRRRSELVVVFKLASLKLASQACHCAAHIKAPGGFIVHAPGMFGG